MGVKEIEALESYFKTENEHWNSYAFKMLCEVLKQGEFNNPEIPLMLFSKAVEIFTTQCDTPLKAVQNFEKATDKQKLIPIQKLFVYEWVVKYLKYSEFEKADLDEIKDLLISLIESLKLEANKQSKFNKPLVSNIRNALKEIIQKEIEQLPKLLKDLEPIQRLNFLCKLLPYVSPKVEAVHSEKGEPEIESKTTFSGYQW